MAPDSSLRYIARRCAELFLEPVEAASVPSGDRERARCPMRIALFAIGSAEAAQLRHLADALADACDHEGEVLALSDRPLDAAELNRFEPQAIVLLRGPDAGEEYAALVSGELARAHPRAAIRGPYSLSDLTVSGGRRRPFARQTSRPRRAVAALAHELMERRR